MAGGVRGRKGERRMNENKLLFFFRERKEERERFSPLPFFSFREKMVEESFNLWDHPEKGSQENLAPIPIRLSNSFV